MDPNNAIEVKSLKKKFTFTSIDLNKEKNIMGKYPTKKVINNVLNGISFNVKKGEILGIIGKNGAGKSTLLSIISKIMEPDSGTVEVNGKIASILELGMGFHHDLSGRENIYLKGELYGFSRKELDKKIDKIIEYSGISKYIDNPIRTYSSGMIARLAFAIMTNVDSDIMLVDEVLSVGDSTFREKARHHFRKMSKSGKTVIFVSHSMRDVETMCTRVIWIDDGLIFRDGRSKTVCSEYNNKISESPDFILDLAKEGVPDSQYKLALFYRDGKNFEKNESGYERLIELAASSGHTDAEVEYAGILASKNRIDDAIEVYQSAAVKGNEEAKMRLASLNSVKKSDIREKILSAYGELAHFSNLVNEYKYAELLLKTAITKEEKKKAFEIFSETADRGYANAWHQMAIMYRDGNGVEKDLQKMEELMRKASDAGHVQSIMFLANTYYQGKLLPRNEKEAFELYLKAAKFGNSDALYKVAMAYKEGEVVDVDLEKSAEYFDLYTYSILMPYQIWATEYVKANDGTIDDFYSKTARFANVWVINNTIQSKIINGIPIVDEIETMNALSISGNAEASRKLGNYYYDGVGVEKSHEIACKYYSRAAELGDMWCLYRVAEMYRDGDGIPEDIPRATELFLELSLTGNTMAMDSIIVMHVSGQINDNNLYERVFGLLKNMASVGNVDALRKIGTYYYNGFGVKRNYKEALEYYEKGAILGDRWCKNKISEMYRDGKGTVANREKAAKWFTD